MTTPLNDADERRLVDAVATAWYGGVTDHWRRDARMVIGRMRDQKITLTIEPEPEPLVELPAMTCKQVDMLFTAIQDGERWENRSEGFDAWFELNAIVNRARCTPEER